MSSNPEWSLLLIGEPWAKMRPRISKAVKGRAPRTHQPPADKAAEEATRDAIRAQWYGGPIESNVRISARFYRATRGTVDLDNLLKHVLDAATGVLWVNDCQVTAYGPTELHLDRDYPRTEITIEVHTDATMVRDYDAATGRVRT